MRRLDNFDNYYCLDYYDNNDILNCIDAELIERTDEYVRVEDLDHEVILTIPIDHISSMSSPTTWSVLFYPKKRY